MEPNKMKSSIKYLIFASLATLWVGLFFISTDFIDSPFYDLKSLVHIIAYWGVICFASFFLIYLMAINRYVFAVLFPVFSLVGALIGFYRYAFKASFTPMIVDATLNTYQKTVNDLISWQMIVFVVISMLIAGLFVYYRFQLKKLNKPYLHLIFALAFILLLINGSHRIRSNLYQRFPYNIYYSFSEYFKYKKLLNTQKIDFEPDFVDVISADESDSTIVILVFGESARSSNFSLNGYFRNTNPLLAKREHVYSLPNIYSEYTYTSRSLAHILTRADSLHTERAFQEYSFISLFKKSGYRTEWISNQNPSEGYVFFMNECDTIIYAHPEKTVYNFNEWYDEDLLPFVQSNLEKNYKNSLLILHTIGSHWYYNNHYHPDFEVFQPTTTSRVITQNTSDEIINSYDNTIVYTDYFLNELIKMLEDKTALLIYISDHGELLGEDGKWLHAIDHDALKHPAGLIWLSDDYIAKYPDKQQALLHSQNQNWRTDFLFHSILSGANLPSKAISNDLNIFH